MDDAELRAHFAETDERFERMMTLMASQFEAMQAHFDKRFDALEGRMGALEGRMGVLEGRMGVLEGRMDALEGRMGALEGRVDAMDRKFEEKFIGVDERFRTLELRLDRFERRVMDRLDTMQKEIGLLRADIAAVAERVGRLEVRTAGLEKGAAATDGRLDGLREDMRQQFRVVNDRLAGLAA